MNQEDVQKLVNIRMTLLKEYSNRSDWRNNKNAIMREIELVEILEKTIKNIDTILSGHVTFS